MNKILSSIDVCRTTAHELKENILYISEAAIEILLKDFWHTAQREGYEKKCREISGIKKSSESKRDSSWKQILTEIEDKTHGGITKKNINE